MIEKTSSEGISPFAYLAPERFVSLTTFRKSGVAVVTPVWFAFDPDNGRKLYVVTTEETGKAKRLRNNPRVVLAPCNSGGKVHGPEVEGVATFVAEAESPHANAVLAKRFGFLYWLIGFIGSLRHRKRTWLEIVPAA